MKIDLHLHSNYSDGNWSPSELVEHAVSIGMSAIALTDHDTTGGVLPAIACAAERLEVIPALEINTIWQDEDGDHHDVHILGYFIELENCELQSLLERQIEARNQQAQELVERLAASGMRISMDMVREKAGSSPIGKVHITQAIVTAGGALDVSEAYYKYCKKNSPFYVARRSAGPREAVDAIKKAGGISSFAHPGSENHTFRLIEELKEHGLNGVEVYHRINDGVITERYRKLAKRLGLLETGGSDDHGPFQDHQSLMGSIDVPASVIENLRRSAKALSVF